MARSADGKASLCLRRSDEKPAHLHLAFTAATREQVDAFHRAALAAGFPAAHEHIEDLKRKNLYTMTAFTEAEVVDGDFMERFVAACRRAAPLLQFQTKALGLRW